MPFYYYFKDTEKIHQLFTNKQHYASMVESVWKKLNLGIDVNFNFNLTQKIFIVSILLGYVTMRSLSLYPFKQFLLELNMFSPNKEMLPNIAHRFRTSNFVVNPHNYYSSFLKLQRKC